MASKRVKFINFFCHTFHHLIIHWVNKYGSDFRHLIYQVLKSESENRRKIRKLQLGMFDLEKLKCEDGLSHQLACLLKKEKK